MRTINDDEFAAEDFLARLPLLAESLMGNPRMAADVLAARDEIERLRGLIAAWADADLRRLDMTRPNEDLNAAVVALREAVGR